MVAKFINRFEARTENPINKEVVTPIEHCAFGKYGEIVEEAN